MRRTTSRPLSFALALPVAMFCLALFVSEALALPEILDHAQEDIIDIFQEGGGQEPSEFRTGGGGQGWSVTSGGVSPFGEQAILTWSLVRDGTAMPSGIGEPNSPSNFIAFLDGIHHGGPGPGGNDFTQRAWFNLIESAFERWDALSAIRFSYEPNDDGVTLGGASGVSGVRGDHRLGGHHIDGITSPTTVAYNYFPNNADMVIDTDEVGRMGNPDGNYIRFRNTLMHEIGHGLGLNHSASSDSRFLLEATLDPNIDGPQFDDILGIHRLYGDRYEEMGGNDNAANATNLGLLNAGQSVRLGGDATDTIVSPSDVDFVSINMAGDTDFYKLAINRAGVLDIVMSPMGPTYQEGPQGGLQSPLNASTLNNLSLFLYDSTGVNLISSSSVGGLGVAESILNFHVTPGNYFVRVSGVQDVAQFYQLDIALVPEPSAVVLMLVGLAGLLVRQPLARAQATLPIATNAPIGTASLSGAPLRPLACPN